VSRGVDGACLFFGLSLGWFLKGGWVVGLWWGVGLGEHAHLGFRVLWRGLGLFLLATGWGGCWLISIGDGCVGTDPWTGRVGRVLDCACFVVQVGQVALGACWGSMYCH